jgi:ADP-ribosyl-[dinitrogen reductase] hydrolase
MPSVAAGSPADRVAGGLVGLLVGDALGVPYEFRDAGDLPPFALIDLQPPDGFERSHARVPPGTWSDDGAQALCLLASLLHCGQMELRDFANRLVNWRDYGYLAVDGDVFDIGIQTAYAIQALRDGADPTQSSPADERRNGNGSLMRVLPLALWHAGSDAELMRDAALQSLPTHAHPRSQVACAFYCLWARAEVRDAMNSWSVAEESLRRHADEVGLPVPEIDLVLDARHAKHVNGSGYVVDTLWSARRVLDRETSYADTVRAAIALGNDTDTTAAVAGGIAGIRFGRSGIPPHWRDALRGRELLDPLLDALLARVAPDDGSGAGR